jgi:hypothetical protein
VLGNHSAVEDVDHHLAAEDIKDADPCSAEGADLQSAGGTEGDTDSAPDSTGYAALGSSTSNLTVS